MECHHLLFSRWLGVTAVSLALSGWGQAADTPQPTEEEARKIASAVPGRAAVVPEQPRRLLVFTLCKGYYHTSIPHGALAVRLMGEKTGAFTATISEDIALFEPDRLKEFDGVCFVSALGELFLPDDFEQLPPEKQAEAKRNDDRLKRHLLEWIKSGKGLVGIHGASWLFYKWPEFSEALGGLFESHPWNAYEKIAVKLDEPDHPVVRAFEGRGFEIIDEGYQFQDPYSRQKNRVLYSLDLSRMETNKPNLRPDRDLGLCWVKRFGEGRVFYTALGHNEEEFWNPALLRHILDGIQFSLGDLAAPSEVSGR
ncbi:MAG: ThuA domain-containing protein [Verrucomicrobia bacterium]|nr:ThuA domain-containing protein [Verrucomicrobiota bacterium]